MNIGILGGTFDPIHLGHLVIAEEAKWRLSLSKVIFIPVGLPWLKTDRTITPAAHRIAMVELAIRGRPCFELSTVEVARPGPSYTVDTLTALRQELGAEVTFFVIVGWDSLNELPTWHNPVVLVKMCKLVAFTRTGSSPPDLAALEKAVPGVTQSAIVLNIPPVDISSTDIRQRAARGLPLQGLVPEEVERYIREQQLYRSA